MSFMSWPEIQAFHNIRKFVRVDPAEWFRAKEQLNGTATVTYKAKVKLHGTNSAVQCHEDDTIVCQSRESIIIPEKDNAGFARWVMQNQKEWSLVGQRPGGLVIYGEWCGPGVQKGVAISEIPKKVFVVFAARQLILSDSLIVEPNSLMDIVGHIPDTYVLPWYDKQIDINWKQSDEDLTKSTAEINDWVMAIEANDPWVEATFGVKGTGEGLVFYPVSTPHLGWESFQNLVFKAKGEKHKNISTQAPAQVNPETVASVEEFTQLALTAARMEQGASKVALTPGSYDQQQTGKFVQWIMADVQKETKDELEASGLTWKQVEKAISTKARQWYLERARK